MRRRTRVSEWLVLFVASTSFAQGTSVITGTVADAATGAPIGDVVVTAQSPSQQGEEIAVTDASGLYRLAQLPAGVFTLRFEKEGYHLFVRPEVTVQGDRTIRVNIQLLPDSVQGDVITIVNRAPTVDIGSSTTGLLVNRDFIDKISLVQPGPTGVRSFDSLAQAAPQVITDQYGFGFSGAQSPENLYLVDGVSVSNPAFGTNGAQFPTDFVEEANVITGSFMPEYGRATGGVLNVTTKSGGNEFHGSVWGNWTPGALSGVSKPIDNSTSVLVGQTRPWNTVDFGAELGGPIMKDRLWFYAGFSPSFVRLQQTQSMRRYLINDDKTDFQYAADGSIKHEELVGTTKSRFNDSRALSFIAKLTYLINADHSLSFSVVGSPNAQEVPRAFSQRVMSGVSTTNNSTSASLKYAGGLLDKHLLVDATLGWFHISGATMPNDGSDFNSTEGAATVPAVVFRRENATDPIVSGHSIADFETLSPQNAALCEPAGYKGTTVVTVAGTPRFVMACPATGSGARYAIGGFGFMTKQTLDRIAARASVTGLFQALGHHVVKAGVDIEHMKYDIQKGFSGGAILQENVTGTRFDDLRQYGSLVGPDNAIQYKYLHSVPTSVGTALYLQDNWSIVDRVTLNAGLRYETQQLFSSDGHLGLTLNNMISPRVGAIYDFTQSGRSKIFANFARYYEAVPMDIADRSLTGESQYSIRRAAVPNAMRGGCDPLADINQTTSNTKCLDPRNAQDLYLFGQPESVNRYTTLTGGGKTPIDPNIQPQSTDEFVVGAEYEVVSGLRVGATYTKRFLNAVIEDMSLDEGATYFIGNPGFGLGNAFPKAVRDYDAVTASVTKIIGDGWQGQLSYTWSSLRGNYSGLFRPETAQLNPNINSDFDLISLMKNRTGPLDADRSHFIKAFASKEFIVSPQFSVLLGLTYQGVSGQPINALASHVIYGAGESFVLPRGSSGRLPWNHSFNLKAGVNYRLGKQQTVGFTVDAFNVLNFQAVTAVDNTLSTKELLPTTTLGDVPAGDLNPNFKRPTAYQAPISIRFGLRVSF